MTANKRIKQGVMYVVLILLSIYTLFPIYFLIVNSFKSQKEIVGSPISLPSSFDFSYLKNAAAQIKAQKAVKQVRNQINRHTNCDTANLSKTARANAQTLKAIRFLDEQGALETLPEALQQAAARRLKYPDLSLAALCASFDPPMSKSGLSHRMKKLEALADALRQRLAEQSSKKDTEEVRA